MKTANEEKEILENIQRRDRKLREGKLKAKWFLYLMFDIICTFSYQIIFLFLIL